MSLISFHRFLIVAAIIFCAGYSGYEFLDFSRGGGDGDLALGVFFLLLTAGFSYYLRHLKRFLGYKE